MQTKLNIPYGEAHVIRSEVRFDLVILDSVANGMQIYVEYTRATSMREHQVWKGLPKLKVLAGNLKLHPQIDSRSIAFQTETAKISSFIKFDAVDTNLWKRYWKSAQKFWHRPSWKTKSNLTNTILRNVEKRWYSLGERSLEK